MWSQILPKMVGGMLIDDDAPNDPTEIIGFKLTESIVMINGKDFDFGGAREYIGISSDPTRPGTMFIHGYCMAATVVMPTEPIS